MTKSGEHPAPGSQSHQLRQTTLHQSASGAAVTPTILDLSSLQAQHASHCSFLMSALQHSAIDQSSLARQCHPTCNSQCCIMLCRMGRLEELSRTLSKFIYLCLHCLPFLSICDTVQINSAFICQVVENIASFLSLSALLLVPEQTGLYQFQRSITAC